MSDTPSRAGRKPHKDANFVSLGVNASAPAAPQKYPMATSHLSERDMASAMPVCDSEQVEPAAGQDMFCAPQPSPFYKAIDQV